MTSEVFQIKQQFILLQDFKQLTSQFFQFKQNQIIAFITCRFKFFFISLFLFLSLELNFITIAYVNICNKTGQKLVEEVRILF
jgi:hypothetical protein